MRDYQTTLKEHLAKYKAIRLGVKEHGVYKKNGQPYPHILPDNLMKLNILETYRAEFWEYLENHPKLKLHQDFHHLNSSQAMCFNLFFPFCHDESGHWVMLQVLGLDREEIQTLEFEKVIRKDEGTNFDFFMELKSRKRILFELKLSENEFGAVKPSKQHYMKLSKIYEPSLTGRVSKECLDPSMFFQYYQILRNISYLDSNTSDHLFFVYPRMNRSLSKCEEFIRTHLSEGLESKVTILFLEDLVRNVYHLPSDQGPIFKAHYLLFKQKYIVDVGR